MSSRGAAFFDLDRTLVKGGSGPIFSQALREAGVLPDRDNPIADGLFGLFRLIGETGLTMRFTKEAVRLSKGWDLGQVATAAESAADALIEEIQPFAWGVIEEHRAAGHKLVIATTTPFQLVEALGERLGFDAVVATRYGESDGALDGTIDGHFVWNRGKMLAVREWAADNGVDLRSSHAYSDSWYDAPLLDAVGHPVAVNPDPRMSAMAVLQGWPIRHLDKPEGVPKIGPYELQELSRPLVRPELVPYARFTFDGLDNLPAEGGAIICGNHRSYFDPMAIALTAAKRNRNVRFLGKKEVFDAPIVGPLAAAMGGIRVDRGTGDDEPLMKASDVLRGGDVVAIMPEGTIPRGPAFFEPELKGRWGAARLAAMAEVPVIPIGIWGTENVWPRSQRLPSFDLVSPPEVTITVGKPVKMAYEDVAKDTKALMTAIRKLLPTEAQVRRKPTDEELARTYPPGYTGDPDEETERRPGRD